MFHLVYYNNIIVLPRPEIFHSQMSTNSKVRCSLILLLILKNPNSDSKAPSITRISTTRSFRNRFRSSLSFKDTKKHKVDKVLLNKAESFKIRSQSNKNEAKIGKLCFLCHWLPRNPKPQQIRTHVQPLASCSFHQMLHHFLQAYL